MGDGTHPKERRQPGRAKKAGVAGLALTVAFVGGWEGLRLVAYRDPVGVPTVCYGETRGVEMGDRHSKVECDQMLVEALRGFEKGIRQCIQPWKDLPVRTRVSLVSWAYNVGVGAACSSTAVRRINAGDYKAGCDAVTWWDKAGGRTLPGLVTRRAAEHALCVEDL